MNESDKSDFRKSKVSVIKTKLKIKVTEKDLTEKLVNRVEGEFITPDDITEKTPDKLNSKN